MFTTLTEEPVAPPTPLVVEVPHGGLELDEATGRRIPREALDAGAVLADSDVGALELFRRACRGRATFIAATASRHVLDLNTEPRMPTAYEEKLPPGLGDVRRISQCGLRWHEPRRTSAELQGLVTMLFEPYHLAIAGALDHAAAQHRDVLLVSAHTFPSIAGRTPDVVIGTRHGATASHELREAFAQPFRAAGLVVALEEPFPGGYSVGRHARREQGRHALQLEVARHLVCQEGSPLLLANEALDALVALVMRSLDAALVTLDSMPPDEPQPGSS